MPHFTRNKNEKTLVPIIKKENEEGNDELPLKYDPGLSGGIRESGIPVDSESVWDGKKSRRCENIEKAL